MIPGSATSHLLGAAGTQAGYQISRSLRFNLADSPSLTRTVASAGDRRTWTWAGWVKRTGFGNTNVIFSSGTDLSNHFRVIFSSAEQITITNVVTGSATNLRVTSAVYRDPSAWMHLVLAVDTTLATADQRLRLYANGSEVTAFGTSSNPAQNASLQANNNGSFKIGVNFATNNLDAYLADIHFIDGQALTPSSFGEFDTNNVWQPKAYTGTYGTNGFRLDFSDNSAATATTLGADRSGNGNNFTPTNLSVTAGAGNDSMVDSPTIYGTDTGAGGEVRGNYCTLNPLGATLFTLSNGNLDATGTTIPLQAVGTVGMSTGKWYWEITPTNLGGTLLANIANVSGSAAATSFTFASVNTVHGFRFDATAGTLEYTTNGSTWTSMGTGLTSGPYFPMLLTGGGGGTRSGTANFGQRPFAYTAPSGYKALCSTNLPTPTITNGATAMDTVLYTGTGATLTPTSTLGFSPDLAWIKSRSAATDHAVYDVVRGAQARLETNQPDAEVTTDAGLTAFNSNGFTLSTLAQVNTNSATYAAWCWDAGTSTVTNTAGTISSQVRANASAGFSVATYTGNGVSGATVGHGLGATPLLVITKNRSVTFDWQVATTAIDGSHDILVLNKTDLKTDSTIAAPTSTVVYRGNLGNHNDLNNNYVMYSWAPVAGFSAFGSYTGNGSTDGPFIYTGFRPRWILIKRTNGATGNWFLRDSSRLGYNADNDILNPNLPNSETSSALDILSNGFKLRVTDAAQNNNGSTYLYAAFAEHPFALARAR